MTVRAAAATPTAGPSAVSLAVAGSATVATAYGMARYGYGLLLPDIQDNLALGATTLGAIGTGGYVAYVLAAALVTRCVARVGERATVVAGGLFAVGGTIIVAHAHGAVLLGVGVAVAGASAGLVYPPFADAVERLPATVRGRTLATINCGTGWGVAVAAPIAIAAGHAWRSTYLGFAACAAVSTLNAARTLRGCPRPHSRGGKRAVHGFRRAALPMLIAAVLVGLGSAAFWTFGVDQVRDAGLDQAAGRALLGVAGVTSVLAIGAADLIHRLGAGRTFVLAALLEAAAIATVGVAADSVVAVLVAAAAFGAAYNTIISVTVLWGTSIYRDQPSAGAAAAVGGSAIGLLCGPLAGGIVAATIGLTATFLAGTAIVLATTLLEPNVEVIQDQTR